MEGGRGVAFLKHDPGNVEVVSKGQLSSPVDVFPYSFSICSIFWKKKNSIQQKESEKKMTFTKKLKSKKKSKIKHYPWNQFSRVGHEQTQLHPLYPEPTMYVHRLVIKFNKYSDMIMMEHFIYHLKITVITIIKSFSIHSFIDSNPKSSM